VQLWLAKAARGELHDAAQPPDPLFFLSALAIIMPPSVLAETGESTELVGFMRQDNPHFIITRPLSESDKQRSAAGFVVLAFQVRPQAMSRLRHAPRSLADLAEELKGCGVDLLDELRTRLKAWAGIANDDIRRLSSRLAIVIAFPVTAGEGRTANDLRAFVSFETAGEVGVALGVLYKNASQVGSKDAYVAAIIAATPEQIKPVVIEPARVHLSFNRDLAASVAGDAEPDRRRVVLVGAGSIGAQLAVSLAREGRFFWTVVDDDYLLPHNLARHALFSGEVGAPKALALARTLGGLLSEIFVGLQTNAIHPDGATQEQLAGSFAEADVIIDASASVAVSRHLADIPDGRARRICVFFNPTGTSVVVMTENADRTVTLRDLEAQYHRLVLTEPSLAGHLQAGPDGVRYSGSCRTLTNRIPATRAALLSAIAARGLADSLSGPDASLKIWTTSDDGQVHVVERAGAGVHHVQSQAWTISYGDDLLTDLARLREARLPNETGGILLGIADMSRRSIHLAHAMAQPLDSHGSRTGFERGVVGVLDEVSRVVESSMNQLRYVGEWHSHPRLSSAWPSATDLSQLAWLGSELASEGLPGLMAIAADDGTYSIILSRRDEQRLEGAIGNAGDH
jgi:ThiF family/Prokaryotic homologs of the JAB domain